MRRLLIALVLSGMFLAQGMSFAQTAMAQGQAVTMVTMGRALVAESEAEAKKAAVDQALRRAVARVALDMIDLATLSTKLNVLDSEILAKAESFVTNYSPQAAGRGEKSVLVLVSVSVDRDALDKALAATGLRLPAAQLPQTLVLVSEETAPGRPQTFWWSGLPGAPRMPKPVEEVLKAQGVKLVDPTTIESQIPDALRIPTLSTSQALELARLAGAGMVIMGRVRTFPMLTPEGQSPNPVAQLLMLETASGKTLGLEEVEGPVFRTTPTQESAQQITQAVIGAVQKLLETAISASPETPAAQSEILVEISGARSLGDIIKFERILNGMPAIVADLAQESVGAGWASYRLKLKAPASQLADQLLLQELKEFLLQVVELSPEKMKLVIIPR
jgi:hypothetical protein